MHRSTYLNKPLTVSSAVFAALGLVPWQAAANTLTQIQAEGVHLSQTEEMNDLPGHFIGELVKENNKMLAENGSGSGSHHSGSGSHSDAYESPTSSEESESDRCGHVGIEYQGITSVINIDFTIDLNVASNTSLPHQIYPYMGASASESSSSEEDPEVVSLWSSIQSYVTDLFSGTTTGDEQVDYS
jgi:hypothetical protein